MNERSTHEFKEFKFDRSYFVVAVSDVHLGFDFDRSFSDPSEAFGDFIEELKNPGNENKIDNFVILGDFLDLWRRDDDDVIKKHQRFLKDLVEMKERQKIRELHYLVGNHDYNIPWYKWYGYIIRDFSRERRRLLKHFKFKKGSSKEPESLTLPENGKTLNGKTFVFRHGHQDREGKKWASFYDATCVLLGVLGNETGWIASLIWKYKYYIPHFVTVILLGLAILIAASSQWLLAGILGAAAFVSFLGMLWVMTTPGYKVMRALRDEEEVRQLKKLKGEERTAQMGSIVRTIQDKVAMDEVLVVEEEPEGAEEVAIPYQKLQELFQQMKPVGVEELEVAEDEDVEQAEDPRTILIVGHTHELEEEKKKCNLGAWVERKDCRILTIDSQGDVEMRRWPPYEATLKKRITSSL